jgi:hypothetical protein
MLRIIINDPNKTDVKDMFSKGGWKISIYRDKADKKGGIFVTIKKGNIEFQLYQIDGNEVELKKFVDLNCVDTKRYSTDGVENCEGTIFLNDHSDPRRCYAFWRNKELQLLMDSIGIEKITFSKSFDETFDLEVPKTSDEGYPFITDGTVALNSDNVYEIYGATYVIKRDNSEIIMTHKYNIENLSKKLLDIVY